jgi:hypothetical protein
VRFSAPSLWWPRLPSQVRSASNVSARTASRWSGEISDYRGALQRAASICRAAGYEYVEILGRARTPSSYSTAVEFTVHHESGEGRVNCAAQANTKQFEQAKKKLAEMDAKKK